MKLHHIPIIVILISLVVMSALTFINEMGVNYSQTADFTHLNNSIKYLEKQENLTIELREEYEDITSVESVTDVVMIPYSLLKGGWTLTKLMFNSWESVQSLLSDSAKASENAGIPLLSNQLIGALISILWITLSAILIYAFFKWKFES